MKIIYCHSCDFIFTETEMTVPNHCPVCGTYDMIEKLDSERAMEMSDEMIESLWLAFGNIDYDPETETILENFMDFPAGTLRDDVWHWFDKSYSDGVHTLMHM